LARVGEPTATVRERLAGAEVPHPLVVDGDGRPLGWMSDRDLLGETVPDRPDTSPEPLLELEDVLRDALSDLLQSDSQYGAVVDGEGKVAGVLSVEIISHFLSSAEAARMNTDPAERVG
jgi:osmoprotectant transport system ATP-binding protein